jgi:hypothetical protein
MVIRRRTLLVFALVLIGSLLTTAVVAVSILVDTRWGRAQVCSLVNRVITQGIAGELVVERIDSLSYGRVVAHGIKILDPDGTAAIEAQRAEIEFEPAQLWSSGPGWSRAVIDHCQVRVSEGPDGKVNMEKTFAKRPKPGSEKQPKKNEEPKKKSTLDLKSMVTSDCKLVISGGSLPTLRMVDLAGIMRVYVADTGDTELRFDEFSGHFIEGLPTGRLEFRDVHGEVKTGQKRLLHFDGKGRTEGERVTFALDITTKPKQVTIDATFPKVSAASLRTRLVAAYTKLSPTLEVNVEQED